MSQTGADRRARFRELFGAWPTGVAVITGLGPTGPAGMTANAVCSLSLDPLLVLACFALDARTLVTVRETERFGVNVLAQGQEHLAAAFASKTAHHESFAAVSWREEHGVPVLGGVVAWVSCELDRMVPGGDHVIAIGQVTGLDHDLEARPLLWHRGGYGEVV